MMSIKDAANIVITTWGIDKTIKTLIAGAASFAVAVGVCAIAIPNSKGDLVIFTENNTEKGE